MQIVKNADGSRTIVPDSQEEIEAFDHIDDSLGNAGFHFHIDKFVQQRVAQKKYDEAVQLNDDLSQLSQEAIAKIRADIRAEMDKITPIQPPMQDF